MSGSPIFSNATLDDTDINKPVYSSMEAKKIEFYAPIYSSIGINNGKIELTFDKDLATISSFDANSFVVKDSGSTYAVNSLTFSNNKAIIGTTHTHTSSNNLTVEYTKPGDLTKAIKTSNGIELEELEIVNNVNQTTISSIINTVGLTFNKIISVSESYDKNDFTIKQGNTALTIDQINISNDGKLLVTTTEAITNINTIDIVYKKNSNAIKHLKDNNNKKINSFRIKNGNDIKPLIFTFNQNITANTNVDKNDFVLRVDGVVKNIHDVIDL